MLRPRIVAEADMSRLTVCLVLLTVLFWTGQFAVYFRAAILAWLDNRVPYEPAVARLRLLFRLGRR